MGPPPDPFVSDDVMFYACGAHLCVHTQAVPYLMHLKQYTNELYACNLNALGD